MQRTGAILVFDNDRSILELLIESLSDEGYTVRTALDSPPAPSGRAEQPPALIVLDLALPAQTVAAVCAYARYHYPCEIPVLFATTNPVCRAADRAPGSDEYLLKPFSVDDLLLSVTRHVLLPRGRPLPLPGVKPQECPVTLRRLDMMSVCW
jgi:two-component system OmpR family response regulator